MNFFANFSVPARNAPLPEAQRRAVIARYPEIRQVQRGDDEGAGGENAERGQGGLPGRVGAGGKDQADKGQAGMGARAREDVRRANISRQAARSIGSAPSAPWRLTISEAETAP